VQVSLLASYELEPIMSYQWLLQEQCLIEAIRFMWIINQVLDD